MEELNDSHQIAICVYNTIILTAFGLTVALILEDKVIIVYGVTSACIIIGTTLTQAIVFLPKVITIKIKIQKYIILCVCVYTAIRNY